MLQPELAQRKVILKNNFCSYKFDVPKNHAIVPIWKARIIYNDTNAEEVYVDVVTY